MLEISDIRIRKILQEGRLRAVVSLTIDNAVAVHDIKLVQGDERMFVAMPSRRDESGTFRDIIHPINGEARNQIETLILKAYDDYLAAESAETSVTSSDSIVEDLVV
jgi:stage V sporulation protein G